MVMWATLAFTAFKAVFVRHGIAPSVFVGTLLGGLVGFGWGAAPAEHGPAARRGVRDRAVGDGRPDAAVAVRNGRARAEFRRPGAAAERRQRHQRGDRRRRRGARGL